MIFSRNIIEQAFLTNQQLEMNMPQIFKTKFIVNFRKYRSRKRVRFGGVKIDKIKYNRKNWRTDSTILGSRMSLVFVVSVVQRQNLTANCLNKPK